MVKTLNRPMLATTMLLATMLVLSGCGRKGDLDLPSTPVEQQNQRNSKVKETPDTPFLLDPLL